MREWISGRNPVYEVVQAGRRHVFRAVVAQGVQEKGHLAEVMKWCAARRVPVERAARQRLDMISDGHQGIAVETNEYPYSALPDMLELAHRRNEPPFLLLLDTLQDPQNLGTLLRAAEAVGVHGVVLPLKHAVTVTPAVVSASSGASEHLLIAQANLAQTIDQLKEAGTWVAGLEGQPDASEAGRTYLPDPSRLDGPLALVVGGEADGMRPLVQKSCDWLLSLPMRGQVDSFNAATAGAIALYLAWQARGFPGARTNPSS